MGDGFPAEIIRPGGRFRTNPMGVARYMCDPSDTSEERPNTRREVAAKFRTCGFGTRR